ncbi:metacaspase-1-like [Coffea eugenioides]|uniref:metacaspase-1-like n=1 Tax=Coffea eugenioides TaxID=49369 RepID=UPI000F60EAD3|nr:metacaspase-1-like [Coffea eugenioides]
METVTCKTCHRISSVTKQTTKIRCHGCQGTILIGNSQVSVPLDISKWPSHDQDNIIIERKRFHDFSKKISGISPRSSPSFSQFPTARISDTPPRGKRALLCGVSYNQNKKFKLRGTTPDVMNMAKLLVRQFGFPTNAIIVLGDFMSYEPPTRMNIIRAFDWLVKDSQSGDSLVFYFSGHGTQQLDLDGDEIDGFDEAICPLDFETAGIIIDNDINKMIVEPLKQGVTLHAIIDACHSGTVLDLQRVYDHNRGRWKDNYPASGAYKGTSGGKAICFSACEDDQQAADTSAFSPEIVGAMTFTFIKAVVENKEITYHGILDSIHNAIEDANNSKRGCGMLNRMCHQKMLQDPMLSSSEPFNANSLFKL